MTDRGLSAPRTVRGYRRDHGRTHPPLLSPDYKATIGAMRAELAKVRH